MPPFSSIAPKRDAVEGRNGEPTDFVDILDVVFQCSLLVASQLTLQESLAQEEFQLEIATVQLQASRARFE